MIRNLKVLGLALVAVFAMSALAAASASAQGQGQLTTEGGGAVTLTGTDTGGATANAFTAFGSEVVCSANSYSGTANNGVTEVTITPSYNSCTAGGLPATVTTNGCDYKFHVGGTVNGNDNTWTVKQVDLVCPGTSVIEVDVYLGSSHGTKVCTIKVGPQELKKEKELHLTNTPESAPTKDDLDLTGTVEEISVSESGIGCGTHSEAGAIYHTDVTVKGEDANGNPKGITISTE